MIAKNISLGRFYFRYLGLYFRGGALRNLGKIISRSFYFMSNWCYFLFLNNIEALWFSSQTKLKAVEKNLYSRYFKVNQFWIALTEGMKLEKPETLYRLTYGESSWFGMNAILKGLNPPKDAVFYDLGCGTGRNVFFANVVFDLKAVGIDLIQPFISHATEVAQEMQLENIQFLNQDIFKTEISEANIVFVTANCFDQECMNRLVDRFNDLAPGTYVISTHRPIVSPTLRITHTQRLFFSWGLDKVFYHQKMGEG